MMIHNERMFSRNKDKLAELDTKILKRKGTYSTVNLSSRINSEGATILHIQKHISHANRLESS